MTEPFDVALRVKLAYEGAPGARTALGDKSAITAVAQRLSAQQGIAQAIRDLDGLVRRTADTKTGTEDLARAGTHLAGSARRSQDHALSSAGRVA